MRAMEKPVPIRVELQPSRGFAALLAAAHAAAVLVIVLMPLPAAVVVFAVLPVIASAFWSISRQALRRGRNAVTALEFTDRETVRLRDGDGLWHGGHLSGSSTVGAVLTVLNIQLDAPATRHVVITADGMDRDDFRRLRVWLRWGPGPAGRDSESP